MNQVSGGKPRVLFYLDCISESFICASLLGLCEPHFERQCLDGWRLWGGSTVCTRMTRRLCFWIYKRVMKFVGFSGGSVVKNPPANAGDSGSIPGSGRSPGEGHGNPLRCSCLVNPVDRVAWWAIVSGSQRVMHDWVANGEVPLWSTFLDWDGMGASMDSSWLPCHQGPVPCSVRDLLLT